MNWLRFMLVTGLVLLPAGCSDKVILAAGCPLPLLECGTECVDAQYNPDHCGVCDNVCANDELCDDGQCTFACVGGTTECGNACVDLNNDPANCGMCGTSCGTGFCSGGVCVSS